MVKESNLQHDHWGSCILHKYYSKVKYLLVFSRNNILIELIISKNKNTQILIGRDIKHLCSLILNDEWEKLILQSSKI